MQRVLKGYTTVRRIKIVYDLIFQKRRGERQNKI
jgi:hypothetical protein